MPDTPTSLTPTDAQLVAGHVADDRSALAAIYDRYSDSLYDTAAAMLHNRHDAADVMQDVFVVAAERLGQLRDADRLKPWSFSASPAGGTLQGSESVEVTVSYDRNWPVEGPTNATTLTFVGPGTFVGIDLDVVIARPPLITDASGSWPVSQDHRRPP